MKQIQLTTAILLLLKEFNQTKQTFSVYDLTQKIRERVNSGEYTLLDVDLLSNQQVNNVRHSEVRPIFYELHNNGLIDGLQIDNSQTSLPYNVFSFGGGSQPTQGIPVAVSKSLINPTPSTSSITSPTSVNTSPSKRKRRLSSALEIARAKTKIISYISRCNGDGFTPTLKNCQSAVWRIATVPISEIESLVKSMGKRIVSKSGRKHSLSVIV